MATNQRRRQFEEESSLDMDEDDLWDSMLEPINRMSKDIRIAAATMGDAQARHLVDAYYMTQENRKRAQGQERALLKSGEPHSVITWLVLQSKTLEKQLKLTLDGYTSTHVMGSWMRQIVGIGPVISAGMLANIDMNRAPTVGHIWQYAGWAGRVSTDERRRAEYRVEYDKEFDFGKFPPRLEMEEGYEAHFLYPDGPKAAIFRVTVEHDGIEPAILLSEPPAANIKLVSFRPFTGALPWKKGMKRPFNADFRVLCWKAGQSFMKFSNKPNCFYGQEYRKRKVQEIERNEQLLFKDQASEKLEHVGKSTEAYKYYSIGKLPPAQIDARARRYAVKLFLAHLHGEWYKKHFDRDPPLPYPIAHLGHVHVIPPPV